MYQDTQARLKKLIGQLNGIHKMLEEKQDCEKITIQFQAAQSALNNAFAQHLEANLTQCLDGQDTERMNKILKLITKQ